MIVRRCAIAALVSVLTFTTLAPAADAAEPQPSVAVRQSTITVTLAGSSRSVPVVVTWGDGSRTTVRGTCTVAQAAATPQQCRGRSRHTYRAAGAYVVAAYIAGSTRPFFSRSVTVSVPATSPDPAPAPAPAPSAWVQDMLDRVNAVRAKVGAGPLRLCASLGRAAADYATVMATRNTFSHTGPDGSSPWDRMAAAGYTGYRSAGENIAAGQPDVASVMDAWIHSPGHYANIIDPGFTQFGTGMATDPGSTYRVYWTQEFGSGGIC